MQCFGGKSICYKVTSNLYYASHTHVLKRRQLLIRQNVYDMMTRGRQLGPFLLPYKFSNSNVLHLIKCTGAKQKTKFCVTSLHTELYNIVCFWQLLALHLLMTDSFSLTGLNENSDYITTCKISALSCKQSIFCIFCLFCNLIVVHSENFITCDSPSTSATIHL